MRVPKFKTSTASLELPTCFNGKGIQLCMVEADILAPPAFRCRVLNFYESAPYCGLTQKYLVRSKDTVSTYAHETCPLKGNKNV